MIVNIYLNILKLYIYLSNTQVNKTIANWSLNYCVNSSSVKPA